MLKKYQIALISVVCVIQILIAAGVIGIGLYEVCMLSRGYDEVDVGDRYAHSIDGYNIKLPQGFNLSVDVSEGCCVEKVTDDNWLNNETVISGYYILGYLTDDYLILCEEYSYRKFNYYAFRYDNMKLEKYNSEEKLFDKFNFTKSDWAGL